MNITLHYLNDSEQGKRRVILENPKWTEVKARIAELDGLKKTEINLKNNDSAEELTIGGGRNRYIISWLRGDGSNGSLISPEFIGSEQQIELIVGGQPGLFRRELIADLGLTLSAAEAFCHDKTLTDFQWD